MVKLGKSFWDSVEQQPVYYWRDISDSGCNDFCRRRHDDGHDGYLILFVDTGNICGPIRFSVEIHEIARSFLQLQLHFLNPVFQFL